ncbi:MAG: DUF2127 domain-containing protein [Nitrosospira multiformis]|nr:DUF2127 domain-containing protein [Nitrosospira multiformis]
MKLAGALRTVAVFEAAKGALALLVGFDLLSLVHHDIQQIAEHLLARTHLNPASRYPHIFIDIADQLTNTRLFLIAAGAGAYSLARFIEAYGLWRARRWAQWFAAASGAIYVPFELFELYERVTWLSLGALTLNLAIIAFMLYHLFHTGGKKMVHSLNR